MNKRYKQKELRNYLTNKKIRLAGLIETRIKEHNSLKISKNIVPNWEMFTNYQTAANRRLWLVWDPQWCKVNLLTVEAQIIHCEFISKVGDLNCCLTIVYSFNTIEHRKALWDNLRGVTVGINKPWLVVGDFNAVMCQDDRLFGNSIIYTKIKEYSACMHELLITKIQWRGDYYTCPINS